MLFKTSLAAIAAAIVCSSALADTGAVPVVAFCSSGIVETGNVTALLFQDAYRLVGKATQRSGNGYRVAIDIACTNPILMFRNYRAMRVSIRSLSDLPTQVKVFIKKRGGMLQERFSIFPDSHEQTLGVTINDVNKYIFDGGDVVFRLVAEYPSVARLRLDRFQVAFLN